MQVTTKIHSRRSVRRGFTLLELVIAALILGIMSVGLLSYQYYATRDARHADAQATASRLAKLVLDHWKGTGGHDTYNPITLLNASLPIAASSTIGPAPADADGSSFSLLGRYRVTINNDHYFLTCSYRDAPAIGPRLLNVAAAWRPDFANDVLGEDAREVRYSAFCGQ